MASPLPPPHGASGPYGDPNQEYPYQQRHSQSDSYGQEQAPPQVANTQQGYPQQAYPQNMQTPPSSAPPASSMPSGYTGRGRRRGYAEEQYEFGAGANSGLTPATNPALGQGMGGYPSQQEQQGQFVSPMGGMPPPMSSQPAYGVPPGLSGVGAGNIAAGGYEPPSGYAGPGMGSITQSFGQMGLNQAGGIQKPQPLVQLFTVDLMQQPFSVAELEFPPPEIVLPPNVWSPSTIVSP